MCVEYEAVDDAVGLDEAFQVQMPTGGQKDVWPGYASIFIRRPREADAGDEAVPDREALSGLYGLIPHWAKDISAGRRTYNARTETVAEKPSFKDAWRLGRHCIIPAEAIYEPDHRSGKAVRTRIIRADGKPMGIAGIWTGNDKIQGRGQVIRSFTMLTINADDHALMKNFHKAGEEKRMVVVLREEDYGAWLTAPAHRSMEFMRQYPAEMLTAVANPTPSRKVKI